MNFQRCSGCDVQKGCFGCNVKKRQLPRRKKKDWFVLSLVIIASIILFSVLAFFIFYLLGS